MKKPILTLFLISLVVVSLSQNYRCINNNSKSFFEDDFTIKVISIDSVVSEGDDLIYCNYPTLAETEQLYCYTQYGPSWIGRKMIAKPDGDNVFYNIEDKPITIKILKEAGEFWTCYEFFTGYYIRATIAENQEMEFLGITDMVKKVTFQAMYSNGTPAIHPVNDMYLLLSENHGLVRTVNFRVFPDLIDYAWEEECHEYNLCGIDEPLAGKQNLTKEQIFNMNIGDEYHTEKIIDLFSGYYDQQYMIYTIIDKVVSADEDTLYYQATRCGKKGEIVNNVLNWLYFNDTIEFYHAMQWYGFLDTLPDKISVDGEDDYYEYSYNTQEKLAGSERMLKRHWNGLYSVSPHDCIEMIITDEKNIGLGEFYYIEGLGGPFYDHDFWWPDYYHLVYYTIGDEEWGNPYNCDSLLVSIENTKPIESEVRIAPNPMTDQALVTFNNPKKESYTLRIFNLYGHQVKEFTTKRNRIVIPKEGLSVGMYLYSLYQMNQLVYSGKVIVR